MRVILLIAQQGDKPPESIGSSLAVSFVGLGRNTPASSGAVGLHESLKVHRIQIFGGKVMYQSQVFIFPLVNLEEWAKTRPISFLASPQEHRRGVNT